MIHRYRVSKHTFDSYGLAFACNDTKGFALLFSIHGTYMGGYQWEL